MNLQGRAMIDHNKKQRRHGGEAHLYLNDKNVGVVVISTRSAKAMNPVLI